GWASCGTSTCPGIGGRVTVTSRPGPVCRSDEPRFWMTNDARRGRPPAIAWKLVPKSTAHADAEVFPSLSDTTLPEMPAEKRSLKFWAKLRPMNVSATLYVVPSPLGVSTV